MSPSARRSPLGVLLAGHRDQVGRYRLDIPCVGRIHPVVAWPQANDLLDDDTLPVVEELPEPVQSDDGGKDPIRFELVQPY